MEPAAIGLFMLCTMFKYSNMTNTRILKITNMNKRKLDELEKESDETDNESRRSSIDSNDPFISQMIDLGLSQSLAESVKQWYASAANEDPYVALIGYPEQYLHFAAPSGNHMPDLRAIFDALPNLDVSFLLLTFPNQLTSSHRLRLRRWIQMGGHGAIQLRWKEPSLQSGQILQING